MKPFNLKTHKSAQTLFRTAGVDEFMSGVNSHDIDSMPPQDQLTKEQQDQIRRKSLDVQDSSRRLTYYLKYPNFAYFSLWDLYKCIQWGMNETDTRKALALFLDREKLNYGIPSNMPDWVYQGVMASDKVKISADTVGDVLSAESGYPEEFVVYLTQKFPTIANAMQGNSPEARRQFAKDYLEFPSQETFSILNNSQKMNEMDTSNSEAWKYKSPDERWLSFDIARYIQDSGNFRDKIKNIIGETKFYGNSWNVYGNEMLPELQSVKQAYESDQEFAEEYNPFTVTIDNSKQFGVVKAIFLSQRPTRISVVDEIIKAIKNGQDSNWELNWAEDIKHDLLSRDAENIPEEIVEGSIYLINEDQWSYFDVGDGGKNISSVNSVTQSYSESYVDHMSRATRITVKEESDLFNEWVKSKSLNKELNDHDYLQLVRSKAVKDMTEAAGSDMFSLKVQNGIALDANNYQPDSKVNWNMVWPFKMQSAIDFWSKVPMRVRSVAADDEVSTWFLYLSGVFPCDKVLEKAKKYSYDLKKVVDYLECTGDSEKLRALAKEMLGSQEKEVKKQVERKLPTFLESDAVEKHKLTDFPEVYEHAMAFLKRNAGQEKAYSYEAGDHIPKSEIAEQKLLKMNIYLIDASRYSSMLGEDGMNYFPATPKDANGFFASEHSIFGTDATIVLFTNKANGTSTSEQILNQLGIDAVSDNMSFSEEGTLWHEVSHSFMDQVVSGENEEIKGESQWVSSPQEVAAISYGNLQHVKQNLRKYFESIYPFPERITSGLINQIKSDIIDTYAWEFKGMSKSEALARMEITMPEFNDDAMGILSNMSQEDQINTMTDMFTEFFMRRSMRGKVEDEMKAQLENIGKEEKDVTFEQERVIPEQESDTSPYYTSTDKFIDDLSQRQDYQKFLVDCQEIVTHAYEFYDKKTFNTKFRGYVHKNDPHKLEKPYKIDDLLLLLFGPPATMASVDTSNINYVFEEAIPKTLLNDVKGLVQRERELSNADFTPPKQSPVSPDEAEEGGQFMAEMDQEYGPDWMWVAKNLNKRVRLGGDEGLYNWYKMAAVKEAELFNQ